MEGEVIRSTDKMMSDEEFDVLDELYFDQPFSYLQEVLDLDDDQLKSALQNLLKKDYIKCFFNMNDEVFEDQLDFENLLREYFYLATKTGLLAHNGR